MRAQGYTLVELVVVIVLIGVLSVVAVVRFDPRPFRSHAAAAELIEAIRYAQSLSMSRGALERYRVEFGNGGFSVVSDERGVLLAPMNTSDWADVRVQPAGSIEFDTRGRPRCQPDDCTERPWLITVSAGKNSSTLRLEPVTGYIR